MSTTNTPIHSVPAHTQTNTNTNTYKHTHKTTRTQSKKIRQWYACAEEKDENNFLNDVIKIVPLWYLHYFLCDLLNY